MCLAPPMVPIADYYCLTMHNGNGGGDSVDLENSQKRHFTHPLISKGVY